MTRDWWQTDPTYVIDDPPKGFECPPILNFVGQMTRDNGLRMGERYDLYFWMKDEGYQNDRTKNVPT